MPNTDQQRAAESILLLELHRTWRDPYQVQVVDGVWSARRLGAFARCITADSATELHGLIYRDYDNWRRQMARHR